MLIRFKLQIGLANIFSPDLANFSGISHDGKARLFVSKFIQKVLFEVDEEGSEASAPAGIFGTEDSIKRVNIMKSMNSKFFRS